MGWAAENGALELCAFARGQGANVGRMREMGCRGQIDEGNEVSFYFFSEAIFCMYLMDI
jgi:hypothetical protein